MEYERAKDAFKTLNGDKPISEYTTAHARKWKDYVIDLTDASLCYMREETTTEILMALDEKSGVGVGSE